MSAPARHGRRCVLEVLESRQLLSASVRSAPAEVAPLATTTLEATVVPAAPRELAARGVSTSEIDLRWIGVDRATGYRIERRRDGSADPFAQIAEVGADATAYQDKSNLAPGTTYIYRVRAFNAAGNSPYSNTAFSSTFPAELGPGEVPAAPRELVARAVSASQINLQWADVLGETNYKIERREAGTDAWTQIAQVGANVTQYQDKTGLKPNTGYIYRVRAGNEAGNSPYSNLADARTFAVEEPHVPAAPRELVARAVSRSEIDLRWIGVDGATGYRIERRRDGSTEAFRQIAEVGAGVTTYADKSELLPGTTYIYRVRAFNAVGNSDYSNTAFATTFPAEPTPGEVPAAPRELTARAVSASQINLTWADVAGETVYKIERRQGGTDTWTQIASVNAGVTRYEDKTGLKPNTVYVYRVRAANAAGNSPYSNLADAKTFAVEQPGVPAAPRELAARAVSSSQINISWVDTTNELGYKLERRRDGTDDPWRVVAELGANATRYEDKGLAANTTYIYRLRAINGVGSSAYSNVAAAKTFATGEQPGPVIGTGNGLRGQYFTNADFTSPALTRVDASVNFGWGLGSPASSIAPDTFSVRWTGQVQAQRTQTYTFYTQSDDGVRLWVNGRLLIDHWVNQGVHEWSGSIALVAGQRYDLKLEYFENLGNAAVRLLWSGPATEKQIIPKSQLYAATGDATTATRAAVAPVRASRSFATAASTSADVLDRVYGD